MNLENIANRLPFQVTPSRLTAIIFVAIAIIYTGWLAYVIRADRPLDFYVYYLAAEATARDQNPYTITLEAWNDLAADLSITNYTSPYRYPPHTAAWLTLLRPLGPQGVMILWVGLNALAMIGGAWLMGKTIGDQWWIPITLLFFFLFVPPLATLLAGQVNGLLFFTLVLAFWAIKQERAAWLGISLALGTILKVVPFALVLYLFWRRQWRAGIIAIGAIAILTVLSLPLMNGQYLLDYIQNSVQLGRPDVVYVSGSNQTISATLGRIFPNNLQIALQGGRWLGLLIVLVTAALCWASDSEQKWMPIEFALIVAALHLIAPFTWYHQLILILISFIVLLYYYIQTKNQVGIGVLLTLYVLTILHGLIWHNLPPLLLSFPFLLTLTLWVGLALVLIRHKTFPFQARAKSS